MTATLGHLYGRPLYLKALALASMPEEFTVHAVAPGTTENPLVFQLATGLTHDSSMVTQDKKGRISVMNKRRTDEVARLSHTYPMQQMMHVPR